MSEYNREQGGRDIRTSAPSEQQAGYPSEDPRALRPDEQATGAFNRPSVEEEYRSGEGIAAKTGEYAETAKEKASEYGAKAQEQVEARKGQAADSMERAAEKLRERASQQGGMPAQAGEKVAEGMEGAASYLREHSTTDMWNDVEQYVREHPGQSLAGAAFAGFILGRMLR